MGMWEAGSVTKFVVDLTLPAGADVLDVADWLLGLLAGDPSVSVDDPPYDSADSVEPTVWPGPRR